MSDRIGMLAMPESTTHWSFEDLSQEHRDLVVKAAAEERVSVKTWLERAVAEHGRRSAGEGAASFTDTQSVTEEITERESERERETAAGGGVHAHHAAGHPRPEDEGEREERETIRRRETLRESGGERIEDGISTYHSRVASRAAAAEAVPVNIWLEEAVVEHARRGERERAPPRAAHPEPPPPPAAAPPATTVVKERGSGERGFELVAAVLVGVFIASLLILGVAWFGSRPPPFFGGGGGGDSKVMVVSPAAPGAAAPFGANVSVTTLVNTAPQAADGGAPAAPAAPPAPPRHRPVIVYRAPCCYHPRPPPDCGCDRRDRDGDHYGYLDEDRYNGRADDGLDGR
jgi:hypothetical protein